METGNAGLYLEPDTSPYTGTTLTTGDPTAGKIVDGSLYTAASTQHWLDEYSYGIDIGTAKEVTKLYVTCYVDGSGGGGE